MSFKTMQNGQVSGDSSTAKKINNLLNSPKSRIEGFQLLNSFLPHCSHEDFVQYCISWMQNCCKIEGLTRNKEFVIQLLSDLFKISSSYQELKKSVSFFITTRYFDFFLKHFLHSQKGWSCTQTCMMLYRGACGTFQESLERLLKNEIGRHVKISQTVAHCYALLPSVGGGGNEGILYKNSWRTSFAKFLSIAHSLLNDLFAGVEELQEYEAPEHVHDKTQNDNSPAYLAIQIHNYCSVLSCMLLGTYPAPKSIPTDLVFHLLCRGLAITPKALAKRQTADMLALRKALPEIHQSFLFLLKALTVTCKTHLLPYSHLVCKLVGQTLEWTEAELSQGKEEQLARVRESAYEVFCNWVAATGSGGCVEVISSVVISSGVSDVLSERKVVLLKEAKHQKKLRNQEQTTRRMSAVANASLCHSALKALQFLLKFAGVSLKREEHKFLQEFVVKLILQVQKSSSGVTTPFDVPSCRSELYALLLELTLQPCPKWPPPTHFALSLLERGLTDPCPRIASFCATALSMIAIIIHPQYNNGGFPPNKAPGSDPQREVHLQWKVTQRETNTGDQNVSNGGVGTGSLGDKCDEGASSGGDSRTTVTFRNASDSSSESLNFVEEAEEQQSPKEQFQTASATEEQKTPEKERSPFQTSIDEEQKTPEKERCPFQTSIDEEQKTPEKERCPFQTSADEEQKTPEKERCPFQTSADEEQKTPEERQPVEELDIELPSESDRAEPSSSAKNLSPESVTEEGQMKKRYFLRSNTKGSSEEPEEAMKRAISVDSLKGTPARGSSRASPIGASSAKRPRTRALSKMETNVDEDEDILASFEDSVVE